MRDKRHYREGEAPAAPPVECGNGSAGASPSHGSSSPGSPSRGSPSRLPQRKRPAHGVFSRGSSPVIEFLTVCTKDRRKWLAAVECHELLVEAWKGAAGWLVGRYVVMPDHIHLFAAPGKMDIELESWVRYWKSMFTRRHKRADHRWQSGYWDVRLRRTDSYDEKWEYVRANPVRHGLVQRAEDWPFQGEINLLEW